MTGDFESMALYAGTGIGRITAIIPAAERLARIVAEAEDLLAIDLGAAEEDEVEPASSVCYAGEMSGAYMGEDDLADDLWLLAVQLRAALRTALARGVNPAASSQPPFPGSAAPLASWSLRLRQLAASESQGAPASHPVISSKLPADSLLLQSLGALIPRISRPALRDRLVRLRLFLEARG